MAEKLNIYQKIAEVMKNIEYLKKDDKVAFGSTSYKAMSEEKVTSVVRAELIKQGLVVYPTKQTSRKEGNLTTVDTEYIMVNIDNPAEQITIASSGQGADTQDKGSGKAMTYAYKYMLLRTFAIPTGEDPDKISSEELDYKFGEEGKKAEIKKIIEEVGGDTAMLLEGLSKKFDRKVKSIDDLVGKEIEATLEIVKAKKEKK